jgi:hypothetical protein
LNHEINNGTEWQCISRFRQEVIQWMREQFFAGETF